MSGINAVKKKSNTRSKSSNVIPVSESPLKEEFQNTLENSPTPKHPLVKCNLENKPEMHPELVSVLPVDEIAYRVLEQKILRNDTIPILYVAEIENKTYLLSDHMMMDIIIKHNINEFYLCTVNNVDSIDAGVWWIIEHSNSFPHYSLFVRIEIIQNEIKRYEKIARENKQLGGKLKTSLNGKKGFQPIDCLKFIAEKAGCSRSLVSDVRYILKNGKPNEKQECREGKVKISSMKKRIRDRIEETDDWKNKRNGANDDVVYSNPKSDKYYDQIIQGDCNKVLDDMEYNQIHVDLGVVSPPYFGAKKDYGSNFKGFATYDEYLHFMAQFIYKFQKIGNDGMRLCIVIDSLNNAKAKEGEDYMYPVNSDLIRIVHELNEKNSDCNLRYLGEFCWHKNHAGGKVALGSYSPMKPVIRNDAESILVWVKGQKAFSDINEKVIEQNCQNPEYVLTKDEYHEFTRKTWTIAPNSDKYRHPAKFPYQIPYRLIKLLSFPGQVVCDPMCGSGVTLKAAKDLGRVFIGIEQNSSFCKMSTDRLAESEGGE